MPRYPIVLLANRLVLDKIRRRVLNKQTVLLLRKTAKFYKKDRAALPRFRRETWSGHDNVINWLHQTKNRVSIWRFRFQGMLADIIIRNGN